VGPYILRNYFRSLEPFCRWLVDQQHLYTNPLDDIAPPSPSKESVHSKAISAEGAELMIENAGSMRNRALIMFFRDTACRLSEAQAMQWQKIDWQKGEVYTIGKFHKPRTLYMTAPTKEALRKYRQSLKPKQTAAGAVWRNEKTGEGLSGSGIYQVFRRIANRVEEKLKFNPHAFRHAFGRDAIAAGISLILLKDVLGHDDIQSTMIYSEVDTETVRRAHNQFSPVNNLDAD
jgi:site-specific recombinase XerD